MDQLAGYIRRWYTRPQKVTHPSSNRARRMVTSFVRRTTLTNTPRCQPWKKAPATKKLDSFSRFDRTPTYDRRKGTVGHRAITYSASVASRGKIGLVNGCTTAWMFVYTTQQVVQLVVQPVASCTFGFTANSSTGIGLETTYGHTYG